MCMCVCEGWERETVCVCVCERERAEKQERWPSKAAIADRNAERTAFWCVCDDGTRIDWPPTLLWYGTPSLIRASLPFSLQEPLPSLSVKTAPPCTLTLLLTSCGFHKYRTIPFGCSLQAEGRQIRTLPDSPQINKSYFLCRCEYSCTHTNLLAYFINCERD